MDKIAVLTSGGDAPGMNASIRAVVRAGIYHGFQVFGVIQGLEGLIKGNWREMWPGSVADIIHRGGTILQTSRSKSFLSPEGREQAFLNLKKQDIKHVVIIGGNGSLWGGAALSEQPINIIGIPATIDNDIPGTHTIGFDTAVNTVLEAINRIRDTASSHGRVFVIEVMGRHCGEIALSAGVGGGAESILIPEKDNDLNEVSNKIKHGAQRGKRYSIILVAEGAASALSIKETLLKNTSMDVKIIILGHVQRGGTPTAADRILASVMGKAAIDYIIGGYRNIMVASDGQTTRPLSLDFVLNSKKEMRDDMVSLAHILST